MDLNPKQKLFVAAYLKEPNGKQAAIKAGYSKRSAESTASALLRNPKVSAEIARLREKRDIVAVVDAAYVVTRLRENVERAMTNEPVRDGRGNPTGEYRYEGAVANRALELLGKTLGLFVEKTELTGKDGGPIELTAEQRADAVAGILAGAAARLKPQGTSDGVDKDTAE